MKWFRSSRRPDPSAETSEPAEPEVHASPGLSELLGGLHPERHHQVLDLGPAVGVNITFFSQRYLCSVEVADLYRSLPAAAGDEPAAALEGVLPAGGEAVDAVLAWDLFNYLEREQIAALARRLAARCRPGAQLFAMVITRPEMPREPGTYPIRERAEGGVELVYRLDRNATRPCPRYRPAEIEQLLSPEFKMDRNLLLRHGIQEYLALLRSP